MKGGVEKSGGDVLDKNEIASLESVAMNGKRSASEGGLEKFRDSGGIGTLRILAWSEDIKKAESHSGERGGKAESFAREFGLGVRAGWGWGKGFGFGHGGIVAVDGTGAGEDEALCAGTGGGGKNKASSLDIHFVATIGMGDRFRNADHSGEMKDVGDPSERVLQRGGIKDRATEQATGKALKVGFLACGKIIQNSDRTVRLKAMDEMASNKARTSCNEKLHRKGKFAEKWCLEKTRENRLRRR